MTILDELMAFGVTQEQCNWKIKEHTDNCADINLEIENAKVEIINSAGAQRSIWRVAFLNYQELLQNERRELRKWKSYLYTLKGYTVTGAITDDDIQRAKEYDIVQLISEDISLRQVNGTYVARCPFHEEDTPSFYIKNNYYYCFGCGVSGDTIKWLKERRGLGFKDAVKLLNK